MHKKFLLGLLGLTLLTILLSACRIIDASAVPQNPKVRMGTTNFIDSSITIKKGQSLDLVDTVASQHVIKNGKWVNGAQQETKESGAPDIGTVNFAGSDTKTIGPFNSAGTFAIYCSIHPNMNLTVTVTS